METSGHSALLGAQKQLVTYHRTTELRPNKCFGYDRAPVLPAALVDQESSACFIVRDGDKQALANVYFENEPGRRSTAKLLTRHEAFLMVMNIANPPRAQKGLKPLTNQRLSDAHRHSHAICTH
jgi:hypothetical protein